MSLIYKDLHHFTKLIKILRIEPSAPLKPLAECSARGFQLSGNAGTPLFYGAVRQ